MKSKTVAIASLVLTSVAVGVGYVYKDEISQSADLLYTPNNPVAVANDFWLTALKENDEGANHYTTEVFEGDIVPGYSASDRAILNQSKQDDGAYFIETTLFVHRDKALAIPLYTIVVSDNGEFKVDVENTLASTADATIKKSIAYYLSSVEAANSVFLIKDGLSASQNEALLSNNLAMMDDMVCEAKYALKQNIAPFSSVKIEGCEPTFSD